MHIIPFSVLGLQDDGYHLIIEVEIFDTKFNMVLDTGASKTVLDKTTLLNAGVESKEFEDTNILSTGLGTNNMQSHILTLPYLKIGNWKKQQWRVAVLDLSTINFAYEQMNLPRVIGVLGGDVLQQYGAVINYKKGILQLNINKIKRQK